MEKQQKEKIYSDAILLWGRRAQLEMAQEEATELALATRKFIRDGDNTQRYFDMAGEIADVEIMIEQIKFMLPSIEQYVETKKHEKLVRLEKRIENETFES